MRPKWHTVFPQFMHSFEAHTPPFSVIFHHKPHLVQGLFPKDFHRHSRYAGVAGQLSQTEEKHFVHVYRRNPMTNDGLEQQILGTFVPPSCLQHFAERCSVCVCESCWGLC